ncbi:MAG: hypothetical protein LUE98_09010 [Tannerellaceae bacterium]|nr:hypothetical protein [Tannerellaceae bacterium]
MSELKRMVMQSSKLFDKKTSVESLIKNKNKLLILILPGLLPAYRWRRFKSVPKLITCQDNKKQQ